MLYERIVALLLLALGLVACGADHGDSAQTSAEASASLLVLPSEPCADHAWEMLTTGYSSACARGAAGTKCWGVWGIYSAEGAFSGAFVYDPETAPPFNVGGSTNIYAAASGWFHTCLAADTGVFCLGDNSSGQLGNGTTEPSSTPVKVSADFGANVVALSSKALTTCALLNTGDVWCWGGNGSYLAGVPDPNQLHQLVPVKVDLGDQKAQRMAVGGDFACVLTQAGNVLCWGENRSGQLGNPPGPPSATPVPLPTGGKRARSITAAYDNGCVTFEDESTACWGPNTYGQLGVGSTATLGGPQLVPGLQTAAGAPVRMDGGSGHFCAAYADGSLKCWGRNICWDASGIDHPDAAGGQLGLGVTDSSPRTTPMDVPLDGVKVTSIKTGLDNTCASFDDGSVKCWGCDFAPMEKGEITLPADAAGSVVSYYNTPSRRAPLLLGDAGSCPREATTHISVDMDWVMAPHFPGTEKLRVPNAADNASADCVPGTTGTCQLPDCNAIGVHVCNAASDGKGHWSGCRGFEFCNGLDDDCDGRIDDGGVCQRPYSLLASGFEPNYFPPALTTRLPDLGTSEQPLGTPVPVPGSVEAQPNLATLAPLDNTCAGMIDENGSCRPGLHPGSAGLALSNFEGWAKDASWTCPSYGAGGHGITLLPCHQADGSPGCRPPNDSGCSASADIVWGNHCQPGKNYLCRTTNGLGLGVQTCGSNYAYGPCNAMPRVPAGWDTQLRACGTTSDGAPIDHYVWQVDRRDGVVSFTTKSCQADFVFPEEGSYNVTVSAVAQDGASAALTKPVKIQNHLIAALGDSISSGEGNPDQPWGIPPGDLRVCDETGCHPDPTVGWVDRRCHRSLLGYQALAARDLETRSLHDSVTFLHLGCSGAQTMHLFQRSYKGEEPDDVEEAPQLTVLGDVLRSYGEFAAAGPTPTSPPGAFPPRPLDALLLQIGANDFGFGAKLELCAVPSLSKFQLLVLLGNLEAGVQEEEHAALLLVGLVPGGLETYLALKSLLDTIRTMSEDVIALQALGDSSDTTSCAGTSLLTDELAVPGLFPNSVQRRFFPDSLLPPTNLFDPRTDDPNLHYDSTEPPRQQIYRVLWNTMKERLGQTGLNVLPPPGRVYIAEYPDLTHFASDPPPPIVLKGAIRDQLVLPYPPNQFKDWLANAALIGLDWDVIGTRVIAGDDGIITSEEAAYAHRDLIHGLNLAVQGAAQAFGWTLLSGMNVPEQLGSHGYAAAPGIRAFRTYDQSKVIQGNIDGTVHPNLLGHGIYRGLLEAALVRDLSQR